MTLPVRINRREISLARRLQGKRGEGKMPREEKREQRDKEKSDKLAERAACGTPHEDVAIGTGIGMESHQNGIWTSAVADNRQAHGLGPSLGEMQDAARRKTGTRMAAAWAP